MYRVVPGIHVRNHWLIWGDVTGGVNAGMAVVAAGINGRLENRYSHSTYGKGSGC